MVGKLLEPEVTRACEDNPALLLYSTTLLQFESVADV